MPNKMPNMIMRDIYSQKECHIMDSRKTSSGGLSFASLLTVAFIVLKLCHVIDWSWVWVMSPMLISIVLTAILSTLIKYYRKK